MTTTTHERIDEMRERINRLEAKAKAAGGEVNDSLKGQADALRSQEASARAASREHADAADAKVRELKARLEGAEHALAAELADDKKEFTDAMQGYLDNVKELSDGLNERAKTMGGTARSGAEAALGDVRRSRDTVAERVAEVRGQAGDRWREGKKAVAASRSELDHKLDETLKKFR